MQRETLQPVRMGNARKDNMRDPGVDEVEVREVLDRDGLESGVPGMMSLEIRPEDQVPEGMLVLVEDSTHFVHVGDPVVIFGAQGEFSEVAECGDADCIKVPASETGVIDVLVVWIVYLHGSKAVEMGMGREQRLHHLCTHFGIPDPFKID